MQRWDDYVRAHPDGTPFHLYNWIKTIYESYNFEPYLYAVKNNQEAITSILPLFVIKSIFTGRRIISLPFTDYCGPLCCNREEEKGLIAKVEGTLGKQVTHIEIRSELTDDCNFVRDLFFKRHVLRLENNASALFNKFDKKTIQYSIRKALKADVEIREDNTPEGMKAFYELNKMTRKKHGVPHQPWSFFENILNKIIACYIPSV